MIGGEHYLRGPSPVDDNLGDLLEGRLGRISFFATGRDALATLLASLPPAVVHLPDLMCASVHDACLAAEKTRTIYRIGTDLLHASGLDTDGTAPTIAFVMHYFGVRNLELMQEARATGAIVVSDVTHLLFDLAGLLEVARHSDYLVASLRKSGAFPDGGFVSSLSHPTPEPARGLREAFVAYRAAGLISRGFSAARNFADDENFHLLKRAEEQLDASTPSDFACSHLSRQLAHSISVPAAASAIRRNIAVLQASLPANCTLPRSPALITPYLPCFFASREIRDQVRRELADHRCFFPVHWPATGLPQPSLLSELSLSIPCDARYGEQAMRSIAEIITSCLPQ